MKTNLTSILLSFFILLFASCSDSKPTRLLESFLVDINTTTLPLNRAVKLKIYSIYDDGTKTDITNTLIYKSSDESIATIESGVITAKSIEGSVNIYFETEERLSNGSALYSSKVTLEVKDLTLQSIELLPNEDINLSVGATTTIKTIGKFDESISLDITQNCNYNSSNETILKADNGVLNAMSAGSVTLSVSDKYFENISTMLNVNVTEVLYRSLSIETSKNSFNVKQNIQLLLVMQSVTGERIILNAEDVSFKIGDAQIVTLDTQTALTTALKKGSTEITAIFKEDESFRDTIILNVIKERYLRFYKNGEELEFPYTQTTEYEELPDTLDTFSIVAIGQDFEITLLSVRDFNFNLISDAEAWFDNLNNRDIISEDENRTFELKHSATQKELHYYFEIDDEFNSKFSVKYKEAD